MPISNVCSIFKGYRILLTQGTTVGTEVLNLKPSTSMCTLQPIATCNPLPAMPVSYSSGAGGLGYKVIQEFYKYRRLALERADHPS